jgi:polar amino acid transport system substrate-binding protein
LRKVIKASLLLVLILAVVVALSGCAAEKNTHTSTINGKSFTFDTKKKDTLSVPMDAAYPPFELMNASNNKFEGFDVDLMNEIAKELGVTVEYSNMVFDSIIADIQTNKDDCSISAFTITAERQKSVDFSDQYYENKGQAIMTKINSTIKKPADLVGKKVGAEKGTVGFYAVTNISGYNANDIHGYDTMPEAFMALQKGDIEAVTGDYAVMYPCVKQGSATYTFAPEFLSEVEYFGIIINKDNKQLTAAINEALAKIKADGRYQTIYDKWFV